MASIDLSSGEDGSCSSSALENKDTSSSLTTTKPTDNTNTSESSTLAKQETLAVNRSKMAVLAVLTVAAIGVGALTYWFTQKSETTEFENTFHDLSIEMEELVHDEARAVFLTISSFASTITSYALATEATWPFITLPHMEVRGMEMNTLTNSLMVSFSPIVDTNNRELWELYSKYNQEWIAEGVHYNEELHVGFEDLVENLEEIYPAIFDDLDDRKPDLGNGPYLPVWQQAPAPHDPHAINYNLLRHEVFDRIFHGMNETLTAVISEAADLEFFYGGAIRDQVDHPHSFLMQPVFEDFNYSHHDSEHIKGVVIAILPWDHYFENILPPKAHGMMVVMKDTCGDKFSIMVDGAEATFLGWEDLHDPQYDHLEEQTLFAPFEEYNFSETHNHCEYDIHIYPTKTFENDFRTSKPLTYAILVVGVFFVTAMVFVTYDYLVQVRQAKVMLAAKKSNLVVASLFPKNVRERIMEDVEEQLKQNENEKSGGKNLRLGALPRSELKNFLNEKEAAHEGAVFDTKPIADLFLSTTIMFADISGFTAWSSVREPTQVFTLLETIYHSFDEIAKRRRVFKVETIGDCYVAVSGLPEPRKDHASVMARFARDCIQSMNDLTKKLEVSLGPDTGDLKIRVGLHSGPVTAGVLRGEKSRFQLFGDTVNTAARMEQQGVSNRIHCSKETADLLKMSAKSHWLVPRKDRVQAKGKGYMDTYFLEIKKQSSGSQTSARSASSHDSAGKVDMPRHLDTLCHHKAPMDSAIPDHVRRKIQWNTDVLLRMVRRIVARRNAEKKLGMHSTCQANSGVSGSVSHSTDISASSGSNHKTVLDEVKEIIYLPEFNAEAARLEEDPSCIQLSEKVVEQMREYVTVIASLYRHDNPFHNFEHASHVTMSVVKLLSRIVAPEDILKDNDDDVLDQRLHDYTFGITSCPLTQFAVAFSALIHDVDHQGVPNTQLVKEKFDIAAIYRNQSVAEQNSVDLAWALFQEDNFKELREVICATDEERKRFRQLVVNVVLATDICDAELKKLRNGRWQKAFSGETPTTEQEVTDALNRKATIVLEHLIQASDVAHTMQHWHIYRKWNECFFDENMRAYREGRSDKDPAEYWYKGELGFFDFYIIPLAKKLKDCGVFGVSSDEYLNYAESNRREWEIQGEDIVAAMSSKYLPPLEENEMEEFDEEE